MQTTQRRLHHPPLSFLSRPSSTLEHYNRLPAPSPLRGPYQVNLSLFCCFISSFPLDNPQGYHFAFVDTIVGSYVLVGWMTGTTMVNPMYIFIALSDFNSGTKLSLLEVLCQYYGPLQFRPLTS